MAMHRASTLIGAAAVFGFGAFVVWLAVPRTIAHATMARGNAAIEMLAQGGKVAPQQALATIAGRKQALGWLDLADGWTDIGALSLMLAGQSDHDQKARTAFLDNAIRAFETGLALAPARPFAWLQLAQAHRARDAASARPFEAALRMSYLTAPMEPRLIGQRVRIGFAARSALSPDMAHRIAGDVRLWAGHDPGGLADWARRQFALPWVRSALASDATLERRFVTAYLALPAR